MSEKAQSFEKHAKFVTGYHKVLFPLLMVVLISSVNWMFRDFSFERLVAVVLAVGLIMTALWARLFALGVQNRLIRLEERIRMERVLPEDLKARIAEVTTHQRIGLRFAPDEELPDLVKRVLAGELTDQKSIKQAIKNWMSDHERI